MRHVLLALLFHFLNSTVSQVMFCERNCPANEVYSSNVSQCHNTCFNQNFNTSTQCLTAPGCVCKAGFIRHQDAYNCIPINSCLIKRSQRPCPDNEYVSVCDANCFKTCSNRNVRCNCVSGCSCRTGYVRSDVTYQCIPETSCYSKL